MKPSSVEVGQVWVLESVGLKEQPFREPVFEGAYLVLRLGVWCGGGYSAQAFGIALDERVALPNVSDEPDKLLCVDDVENLLHAGERMHEDSSFRWRHVFVSDPAVGQVWTLHRQLEGSSSLDDEPSFVCVLTKLDERGTWHGLIVGDRDEPSDVGRELRLDHDENFVASDSVAFGVSYAWRRVA